jgi:hypothetical protein
VTPIPSKQGPLLSRELHPASEGGLEALARFLGEAQRLPGEARQSLAGLLRKEHGQPLWLLVEHGYPSGSERRRRLGAALVEHAGGESYGLSAHVLEGTVDQVVASLTGGVVLPTVPPRAKAPATPRPVPIAWAEKAPLVLAGPLHAAADVLARLEGRVDLTRTLLSTVQPRGARARYVVDRAEALLEEAQFTTGLARELTPSEPDLIRVARGVALACRELTRLRGTLFQLHDILAPLARRASAVRPTPGEIGDADRIALEAREALCVLVATARLLLDLHRGGAPGSFAVEDATAMGTAFEAGQAPPQIVWDEGTVSALVPRPRDAGPAAIAPLGAVPVTAVLAAVKDAGLDLTRVDPGQIAPAARYASSGLTAGERRMRLAKAVSVFRVLANASSPALSRTRTLELLRSLTGLPERPLAALPEAEAHRRLQEIARAVNLGPGVFLTKVGAYQVALVVDAEGAIVRRSCRKRGLLTAVGRALATPAPLALGLVGLSRLGAVLLRSAARAGEADALGRHSHEMEAEALNATALASYRAVSPLAAEARRQLATALSSSDPSAITRAQRRLQEAMDRKRGVLHHAAGSLFALGSTALDPTVLSRRAPGPLATTGAALRSLARELRRTLMMVERAQHAAGELYAIARRFGLPESARVAAAAAAFSVEQLTLEFRRQVAEAEGEEATLAARQTLEHGVAELLTEHRRIQAALAEESSRASGPE